MANLKEHVQNILLDLKKNEANTEFPGPKYGLPGLIDAGNGQCFAIGQSTERSINAVADILLLNDPDAKRQFTNPDWRKLVRKAFGPALADSDWDDPQMDESVLVSLRATIEQARKGYGECEYTLGCSLFASSDVPPIEIGPVTIEARDLWLSRVVEGGKISETVARRVRRAWAGARLRSRKNLTEWIQEREILGAVGPHAFVCSIKTIGLPPNPGQLKAITAARLALAVVSLPSRQPSAQLDASRLQVDHSVRQLRVLAFEPGKISFSGSKLSRPRPGHEFRPGEWEQFSVQLAPLFKAAGEVLTYVVHPTGKVARPSLSNVLMQALLWFHEACREEIDAMAIVKFAAALDALAGGKGERGIYAVLRARVGWKDGDPIYRDGDLTMKRAVDRVYRDGRNRTIHGTNDQLSHDWSELRSLAEVLAKHALLGCLEWAARNPGSADPKELLVS